MSDCKHSSFEQDAALPEHCNLCQAATITKLEAENKALRTAVEEAFIEGWSEGHEEGLSCGHALAPRCRHSAKAEWLESEALALTKGN